MGVRLIMWRSGGRLFRNRILLSRLISWRTESEILIGKF
ncbi:hypothetical protein LINGRAHAP2_LOCUS17088 [Linum grandiflorum]